MALSRLLGLAKKCRVTDNKSCVEHQYYRNKCIAFLWPWVQLVDILLLTAAKIFVPLKRGHLIVLDRFIIDILVDLMVDVNDPHLCNRLVGRTMLRLIPRSTITLLLDVEEQTALLRKADIPDYGYVAVRRRYYRMIAQDLRITSIDSSGPFEVVHEQMTREVRKGMQLLAMDYINRQLQSRLQARLRWQKMKNGPIVSTAVLKRLVNRQLYRLIGVRVSHHAAVPHHNGGTDHNIGRDEFGRDMGANFPRYLQLLRRRGLRVHTVVLSGSRAKSRWNPASDLDIIVIASGLPGTHRMNPLIRRTVLSDFPLFLGVQSHGFGREEFLQRLVRLDLMALDALCWGRILFDDGFWLIAKTAYERIRDENGLETDKLRSMLSTI